MMSGIRTPVKKAPANTQSRSPQTGTEEAGSLSSSLVTGAIVNKTISPMRTMTVSPTKTVGRQVTPTSKPTRTLIAEAETRTQSLLTTAGPRRVSTDRPLTLAVSTYVSRTKEASVCITKIRKHLEDSRNLKKEIKTAVVEASERLYQLVRESEAEVRKREGMKDKRETETGKIEKENGASTVQDTNRETSQLMERIAEHSKMLLQSNKQMEELKVATRDTGDIDLEVPQLRSTLLKNLQAGPPLFLADPAARSSDEEIQLKIRFLS
ncbi:hypothetical protein PYW07_014970 [Mythimna separata]|uniref:Uncharacterized protein n=1 Tax=Mythimna separata TaxID=271217 RepID=A0AAD7YY12_MYTSE|nr:hypothetical protein PYW07_014970 [Mythimna separata]